MNTVMSFLQLLGEQETKLDVSQLRVVVVAVDRRSLET